VRIIGVIDLLAGRAVHAKGGCRHGYRPIDIAGEMSIRGDATALARMYRALGIDELYVADLDAIAGGAEQDQTIRRLAATGARLWVDAGVATPAHARRVLDRGAACVVVGLETLTSFAALREIVSATAPHRVAFSLDLRDGRPITTGDSMSDLSIDAITGLATGAGATSIIVLDLARVGSGLGLDLRTLEIARRAAPGVSLLAGGGVRDENDLRGVASAGCDGVLMATALHGPQGNGLVRFASSLATAANR
jgi:phosphoribosylformimino-5-aminoimidazole carboxamide ribotide isomerase